MAEGRVPQVVGKRERLDQVLVQRRGPRHRARDLAHLEAVGEARPVVVPRHR